MLKISTKRGRDWSEDLQSPPVTPCSPHRITTLDSTPTKKYRPVEQTSQFVYESSIRADSPFSQNQQQQPQTADQEALNQLIQQRKIQSKPKNELTEKMFSYNEVREIVARAVAEREAQLRVEYDRILQEKLQEQYISFSKFNEDYVSRQFKSTDFSYLS